MDANRRPASGARPLGVLFFEKGPQTPAFYTPQIFNHTHSVVRAISLIQTIKPPTREARTAEAKIATSRRTILDFASDPRLGLPAIVNPAPGTFVAASQIRDAQPAVHSARGDHDAVALHFLPECFSSTAPL